METGYQTAIFTFAVTVEQSILTLNCYTNCSIEFIVLFYLGYLGCSINMPVSSDILDVIPSASHPEAPVLVNTTVTLLSVMFYIILILPVPVSGSYLAVSKQHNWLPAYKVSFLSSILPCQQPVCLPASYVRHFRVLPCLSSLLCNCYPFWLSTLLLFCKSTHLPSIPSASQLY